MTLKFGEAGDYCLVNGLNPALKSNRPAIPHIQVLVKARKPLSPGSGSYGPSCVKIGSVLNSARYCASTLGTYNSRLPRALWVALAAEADADQFVESEFWIERRPFASARLRGVVNIINATIDVETSI